MSGLGPTLAIAAYAALLWGLALALDAVAARASARGGRSPAGQGAIGADVARFHRAIGGALLAVGGLLVLGRAFARLDGLALLLLPLGAVSFAGALRRVVPLWREP